MEVGESPPFKAGFFNFLAPEVRRRRRVSLILIAVSVAAALVLAWQADAGRRLDAERAALAVERNALGREAAAAAGRPSLPVPPPGPELSLFLQEAASARPFSWTALLLALEEALPKEAALTRIQAQGKDGTVILAGRARDASVPSAFVESLDRHGSFAGARLVKISPPEDDAPAAARPGSGKPGRGATARASGGDGALFEIRVRYSEAGAPFPAGERRVPTPAPGKGA
ncbi:MAG: PilN domain-containing protein [Nitrospirae bacterium]|nr:PilN domain-containing protein [Nitrospirota bacterium]